MRLPAVFVTALATALLVYADLQGWPVLAIVGLVCAASAAVGLAVDKYSGYVSGFVAMSVIVCDAVSRHYEAGVSLLHNSVTLGDFSYAVCLFAVGGWIGGWLLRRKHVMPGKMQVFDPPPAAFMISPALSRRPSTRGRDPWAGKTRSA